MIAAVIDEEVKSINQQSQTQTTVLPLDIFKNDTGDTHIAFRLIFNSLQRTLTTDEVSEYLHQLEAQLKFKVKAIRI